MRQTLAVSNVEPQMVSLVRGWVLVLMQQDDKADVPSDHHSHVRVSHDGHRQHSTVHEHSGVTGQDNAVLSVQDDFLRRHLDVGAFGTIHHYSDGAEVCALLLVAAWRRWSTDELSVHCNT